MRKTLYFGRHGSHSADFANNHLSVDSDFKPCRGSTHDSQCNKFMINHYYSRSENEARAKSIQKDRNMVAGFGRSWEHMQLHDRNDIDDNTILRFLPRLKSNMVRNFSDYTGPLKLKIKLVIVAHNNRDTASEAYKALSPVFDTVVIDSGSDDDKVPACQHLRFENLYWTGCWNKALELYGDSDVLWVIGGDIVLQSDPSDYKKCIEELWPFGVWSPVIDGNCHPLMSKKNVTLPVSRMWMLEGMAFAVNTSFLRRLGGFPVELKLGWGQDIWISWESTRNGLPVLLDGRVSLHHPFGTGYNTNQADVEMSTFFNGRFGPQWKKEVHFESNGFQYQFIGNHEFT